MPDQSMTVPRSSTPLMPSLVGFYFAARLCITFLLFQSDPKMGAYVNFALHFALLLAVMLYSFGPGTNSLTQVLDARPLRWALAFLTMGLCSLAWSATISKPIAFAYWCELAAETVMILLVLRVGDLKTQAESVMKGYVLGAIVIAAVEWLSPTMYDLRPGDDDYFSPNAIGFTCAFAVFLIQIFGRSSFPWRMVAALLAISLLRSLSKTTIIAFVAAQALQLLLDRSQSWRAKLLLLVPPLVVTWTFQGLIVNYYEVYTHLGNQSETLSGRIGIWAFVLTRSLQQPWVGHGFHSFRNVIPPFGSFEAWHAHNELLQQFYAYGAAGVVLLGGIYGSLFKQFRKASPLSLRVQLMALMLFILIRGLADTENFDLSLPIWYIALISIFLVHQRAPGFARNANLESRHLISTGMTEEYTS
ncbi:O-antigen ligase family protein [Telmatobacter sp. DSM 110680]|uniref:O-antigen ligase family protein n=1 Tax=Telmatobacter sp. DSM 110680 TaxID=3036704 RepID=A0AAU7DL02_9BACT